MDLDAIVLPLVALAAAIAAAIVAWRLWTGDQRVEDRLNRLSGGGGTPRRPAPLAMRPKPKLFEAALPKLVASLLPNDRQQRFRLQARLMHAGIYAPYALIVFQTVKALLSILPPLVGFALGYFGLIPLQKALLVGGVAGSIGMILPSAWLDRTKAQRQRQLNRALPDALDLMVTCVEAGLSLEACLARVTEELRIAHPILASEMSVVQRQMEFGAPADEAFALFAERTDLESLSTLSTLLQQARRFGTGVSDALRTQSEMLRNEREQIAEELAQKAAVKILIPTLLLIFPAVFVVLAGPAAIQLNEAFSESKPQKSSARR